MLDTKIKSCPRYQFPLLDQRVSLDFTSDGSVALKGNIVQFRLQARLANRGKTGAYLSAAKISGRFGTFDRPLLGTPIAR